MNKLLDIRLTKHNKILLIDIINLDDRFDCGNDIRNWIRLFSYDEDGGSVYFQRKDDADIVDKAIMVISITIPSNYKEINETGILKFKTESDCNVAYNLISRAIDKFNETFLNNNELTQYDKYDLKCLSHLVGEYKYLVRNRDNSLSIFSNKPIKDTKTGNWYVNDFSKRKHMDMIDKNKFRFVKLWDKEPYKIHQEE